MLDDACHIDFCQMSGNMLAKPVFKVTVCVATKGLPGLVKQFSKQNSLTMLYSLNVLNFQEIEKKKGKQVKPAPKLTKKQEEALQLQLKKESEIRAKLTVVC